MCADGSAEMMSTIKSQADLRLSEGSLGVDPQVGVGVPADSPEFARRSHAIPDPMNSGGSAGLSVTSLALNYSPQ